MRILLTREAERRLHEATEPHGGGPYVNTDLPRQVEFNPATYERIVAEQRPGESISDTIIRLCNLLDLLRRTQ